MTDPLSWGEDLLPNGDDYINHTRGHEHQTAMFANATYAITPELKVQVGARVAQTHFDFTNFSDGAAEFRTAHRRARPEGRDAVHADGQHHLADQRRRHGLCDAMPRAIASAAPIRSSRCSACTEITTEPKSYNSDSVTSYEAGSKDKLFGGRLRSIGQRLLSQMEATSSRSSSLPSCGFRYTTNQGAAESKGFDLRGRVAGDGGAERRFQPGLHRRALHRHQRLGGADPRRARRQAARARPGRSRSARNTTARSGSMTASSASTTSSRARRRA